MRRQATRTRGEDRAPESPESKREALGQWEVTGSDMRKDKLHLALNRLASGRTWPCVQPQQTWTGCPGSRRDSGDICDWLSISWTGDRQQPLNVPTSQVRKVRFAMMRGVQLENVPHQPYQRVSGRAVFQEWAGGAVTLDRTDHSSLG